MERRVPQLDVLRSASSSATDCSHMPRSTAAAGVMHAASHRPASSSVLTAEAAALCFSLVGNAAAQASAAACAKSREQQHGIVGLRVAFFTQHTCLACSAGSQRAIHSGELRRCRAGQKELRRAHWQTLRWGAMALPQRWTSSSMICDAVIRTERSTSPLRDGVRRR